MLQTQHNVALNSELIGFQWQLNVATAGRFAELFGPVICVRVVCVCVCTYADTLLH